MQWNELPALFILDYCEMYSSNILCQSSQSQRKLSDLMKVRAGKSESLSDCVQTTSNGSSVKVDNDDKYRVNSRFLSFLFGHGFG